MIDIYNPDNTDYDHNGNMTLFPSSAIIHPILNGVWEVTLEHPIDDDNRWKYIVEGAVLKMPSFNGDQLFRIVTKEKSDSGITATAEPVFMDARGDCFLGDVRPTLKNGQQALDIMCAQNSKYSGASNITTVSTAYYEYKNLIEAINGDDENSFINRWGGEILFDNYKVIINDRVGGDYGLQILYGRNVARDGIREEIDTRNVVTRIYPKAYNGHKLSGVGYVDSELVNSYPTIRTATMTFDDVRMAEDVLNTEEDGIIICNSQEELDEALSGKCLERFAAGIDKPTVTISIDLVMLQNTDEYQEFKNLEEVSLGDTVHCRHSRLGIETTARVIELEYDAILKKVTSVVIGDYQYNFFDNVSSTIDRIDKVIRPDGSLIAEKVKGFIDGAMASLRAMYNAAAKQDVLAILFENLDESNPLYGALAIGTQGVMISKKRTADGRGWDWTTALTSNGLFADIVVAGILSDKLGINTWNLDTGELNLSGEFRSVSGDNIVKVSNGFIQQFYEGKKVGDVEPTRSGTGLPNYSLNGSLEYCKAVQMGFVDEDGYVYEYFIVNNGLNPGGYTERLILRDDTRVYGYAHFNNGIYIGADDAIHMWRTLDDDLYVSTGFYAAGDIGATGTKSRIVDTDNYGRRLMYCYEMPTPVFGDIGQGDTDDDGLCYVSIDDIFLETVNTGMEYQVFLQAEGDGSLYVVEKESSYFVVKGTPNLKFSWEIKAKQKDYEYNHLERFNTDAWTGGTDYESVYGNEIEEYLNEMEELQYESVEQCDDR